jgi:hypothetical protein
MKHLAPTRRACLGCLAAVILSVVLSPARSFSRPGSRPDGQAGQQVESADLRPALSAHGLTPRVQGRRGTCPVFAMTQAIEFALARQGGPVQRLSPEFLNWASNQAAGDKDDGSFFSDLWKGFVAYGICLESAMPYAEAFDPAAAPSRDALQDAAARRNAGLRFHWIKEWDPKRGLNEAELRAVTAALAKGWPVSGGFLWPKKAVWTEGVLGMCPRDQVFDGHSLLLVGFRSDPKMPGGGVFLIRNSGGPSRDGFVTYEFALAYMNDAAWIDVE